MAQLKDSLITGDLRVTGTIYGKATNAVLADEATAVRDKGNGTLTYLNYGASGMSTTSWVGSWDGYTLKAISPANLKTTMSLNNVENTKLSTWAGSSNITTIGTLSSGTVPWARLSNVPSASTSAAGIIQIGTGASNAAAGNHTHTTSLASDTGTSTVTLTSGGKFKLTAGGTSVIFTMPTSTNNAGTITGVTGSDGLIGSGTSGSVTIKHAAPSTSPAKTTSAVYPITIDKYGHITAAGNAVTIPAAVSVKGNAESSYRTGQVNLTSANIGAVALSGNETVSGNKTFSGQTTLSADSIYTVGTNTKIVANSAAIIQSPIPKYLWHDLFAFNYKVTPTYYITTNNSTWTEATLDKRPFAQKENFSYQVIKATGQTGSRWVWHNNAFSYSSGIWLVIGVAYASPVATATITFETSSDGNTWTTRFTNTHNTSSAPIWCYLNGGYGADSYLRLTITKDTSDTTKVFNINAIKLLTVRWGDQGGGSEYEYPYSWDENKNVTFPAQVTATTLAGNLNWSYIQNKPTIPTIGTGANNAAAGNHTHPIKTITGTIPTSTSSPWTINATNKTVQISDSKITAKSVLQWGLASTATQAQYEAFAEAQFIDSTTAAGSATIKALGTMPTIAIPIVIHILGETE